MYNSKALFLDRDGVINKEINYLFKIEDLYLTGVFLNCVKNIKKGYKLIVITNQAGIARGYYSEKRFNNLTNWMIDEFSKENYN